MDEHDGTYSVHSFCFTESTISKSSSRLLSSELFDLMQRETLSAPRRRQAVSQPGGPLWSRLAGRPSPQGLPPCDLTITSEVQYTT